MGQVLALQPVDTPWQTSAALHETKPSAWQFWHAWPRLPHAVRLLPVWQAPVASQQPTGHVAALQEPVPTHVRDALLHSSFGGHAEQRSPCSPHASVVVPATHAPDAVQHPVGQVAALQRSPSGRPGPSTFTSRSPPSTRGPPRSVLRSPHPATRAARHRKAASNHVGRRVGSMALAER